MDILIFIVLVAVAVILGFEITHWIKEKCAVQSVHLKSAALMVVCFTVMSVLIFGSRILLKPDVVLTYTDTLHETYTNLSVNDKGNHVLETKRMLGCEVQLVKSYPLMITLGRDSKALKYKMPCDTLTPEMKTEVANLTAHLKENK